MLFEKVISAILDEIRKRELNKEKYTVLGIGSSTKYVSFLPYAINSSVR